MSELQGQVLDAPAPAAGGEPYDSFYALRHAHIDLRRSWSDGAAKANDVRQFIARTINTGALLEADNDRRGAQGILDYWSAELVTLTSEKPLPSDFTPAVLAQFDARHAGATSPALDISEADMESTRRSREVIRFVAAARLWQDSGRKAGYLLYGDAIAQAAQYRDVDPDIAELVNASEAKRDRKRMNLAYAATAFSVAIGLMIAFETVFVDKISKWLLDEVRKSETSRSTKVFYLRTLQVLHRWQPPYDFSGLKLDNISAPDLHLHSPNFSAAKLRQVDFQGAKFSNATFSNGEIFGNFGKADLSRAQFWMAKVEATSFANSILYRASFNRACLNNVDFSGADLRLASFWGASFEKGRRNFRNAAWWLAAGWNSDDLRDLVQQDQSSLRESPVFKESLKELTQEVRKAEAGTAERAYALNEVAWEVASWGLVDTVIAEPANTTEQPCGSADGVPSTALEAVEQAVCIARLRRNADAEANYAEANYADTQAYILMQTPGRLADALNIYRTLPLSDDDRGGRIFRVAVAHHAAGDKTRAMFELQRAINARYVPTHELQTLKAHITGEFQTTLYEYLNTVWPRPEGASPCQFGSDAVNP